MKPAILLVVFAGHICQAVVLAEPQIQDYLEVNQSFTLHGDAFLEGGVSLGKLPATQTPGFRVDVSQSTNAIERELVMPGHYEPKQVWVEESGNVPNGTQQVYIEEYGWVLTPVWIEDFGWGEESIQVDDYGITGETQAWVEDYGDVSTQTWVEPTYDNAGNILVDGHYETRTSYGVIGGHYESVPTYGITGSHTETRPVWTITGGHWQDDYTYGVIGGHYEEQTIYSNGVVGGHWETQDAWIAEQRTSVTETVFGLPVVRFTGQSPDLVWSWRNAEREILELTTAGLSLPYPSDTAGSNRAVLTATQFEQSYTTPAGGSTYDSHGVKLTKEGVEAWHDEGTAQAMNSASTAKFKPEEIIISRSVPSSDGTSSQSMITRIAANDAEFAGNVAVKGVLRVRPAGNLSMGAFTSGPQP